MTADPAALLALIGELYASAGALQQQVVTLQAENAELREALAEREPAT